VREGFHDCRIRQGGLEVYPRLVAAEHHTEYKREVVKSGHPGLDRLLGGGLARGTSNLFLGPAGTGKSSIATQYAHAGASRGQHSAIFLFDESVGTYVERSAGLGFDVKEIIAKGKLLLRQVDPAELAPGEFASLVRQTVERNGTRIVVIDSLTGYLNAMPSERLLTLHLHELLTYLARQGVTTIMILAQHGLVGAAGGTAPVDTSYLADTVLLLRYFETHGAVSIALSVIKKRTGMHERTIRPLRFDDGKLTIGEPITDFVGVLSGIPRLVGGEAAIPRDRRS
jgi:circadian clock protein KaiC